LNPPTIAELLELELATPSANAPISGAPNSPLSAANLRRPAPTHVESSG